MTGHTQKCCEVEITSDGYLRLTQAVAGLFFQGDTLVALCKDDDLVLLPTRGSAGGGLILKQRNPAGDRSVLIAETLDFRMPAGRYVATWDDRVAGLRVAMRPAALDGVPPPGTASIPRPQPVGIFAFPRSHLLVPRGNEATRAALMLGDGAAAEADLDSHEDTLIDRYNAFVLTPSPELLAAIEAAGDAAITALSRAAAFAHGLVDDLPESGPLDGELAALVRMTAAAGWIERGDANRAVEELRHAVAAARQPAPVFAAILEMQLADMLLARPGSDIATIRGHLDEAVRLSESARLPLLAAELWMRQGVIHQQAAAEGDRSKLLKAVNCYQMALATGVTEESNPACYGQLQNNLGLAYLSMPSRESSDLLRTGIAVQSFRHALKVYDRERDPDMWSSVKMNLASALQYLPSSHPQDNLMQAIDTYEEVLEVRTEARDPVAHARVLLNEANALAHLGIFKPAIEKLAHAYKLFSWHECFDESLTAKEMLDQIQQQDADLRATLGSSQGSSRGAL
jgi:tetratricopeptide (TPR) repeat protein